MSLYGFDENKEIEEVYSKNDIDTLIASLNQQIEDLKTVYEYTYTNNDLNGDYYELWSNTTMKVRRSGNVVHLFGTLRLIDGWTFNTNLDSANYMFGLTVAETALGVRLRPNNTLHFICNGTGSAKWMLNIPSDNTDCYITRYNDYKDVASNYSYAGNGTYLPFSATWIVNDEVA